MKIPKKISKKLRQLGTKGVRGATEAKMFQIGKYRVHHQGGCWHVTDRAENHDVSTHEEKWAAIRAARMYSWRGHHKNELPVKAEAPTGR